MPTETNCMKFRYTPTPKTTTMETVETQAAQATEQLISNYLDPNDLIEELPDLFNEITPDTTSTTTIPKTTSANITTTNRRSEKHSSDEGNSSSQPKTTKQTSMCSKHSTASQQRQTKCG
ncbi:Hypothetical predicted protein [Paramuricea clavata]|uniref:Uncharacterized protein n=1 Tax=Paramuricea clavata TaxID=317549 RepID=A0A6S7JEY1_PARCT|nr:Hypothetical predicted protein [Paramuricea clavata]